MKKLWNNLDTTKKVQVILRTSSPEMLVSRFFDNDFCELILQVALLWKLFKYH